MRDDYRIHDPAKGSFDPRGREQHGPLRPGKTREDRMKASERPRVRAWQARSAKPTT